MSISDKISNAIFGTNIRTITVSADELADIIDRFFVRAAQTRKDLDDIEKTISGSLMSWKELYSADEKYWLHVGNFERGLTVHRRVWVKNFDTEEVFEWKGYTLGAVKQRVIGKITQRRLEIG